MTEVDVPMAAQAALRKALADVEPELVEAAFARIVTIPYTGDCKTYVTAITDVALEVIMPVLQARNEQLDREIQADRVEQERRAANAAAFAEKLRQHEAFRDCVTSTTIH
jgi:hypothetical protein